MSEQLITINKCMNTVQKYFCLYWELYFYKPTEAKCHTKQKDAHYNMKKVNTTTYSSYNHKITEREISEAFGHLQRLLCLNIKHNGTRVWQGPTRLEQRPRRT